MIDLSFITVPLVCLLVIYAVTGSFYTFVAALFPLPKVKRGDSSPLISIVVPANNEEKVIEKKINNNIIEILKNYYDKSVSYYRNSMINVNSGVNKNIHYHYHYLLYILIIL